MEYSTYIFVRFSRDEVYRLAICMRLPDRIECENQIFETNITALCMLLARLSWPNRLSDLHIKFGWKPERVSRTVNTLLVWIHDRWKHLLVFDAERLTPERLVLFTNSIRQNGAPLETCFGFIDGTLREIARPIYAQEAVYNGWKRKHCLKYQAVVTPDGIIIHLFGPVEGTKHDALVYRESGLSEILENYAHGPDGTNLQLYGDPAYSMNEHLISPYGGAAINEAERNWNKAMSRVRIVVEWCFKEVLQMFTFLDFKRSQKILLSPVGLQYPVAVLLHNAHVCLHRPQISQFFEVEVGDDLEVPELLAPPTLEEYFHYIEGEE